MGGIINVTNVPTTTTTTAAPTTTTTIPPVAIAQEVLEIVGLNQELSNEQVAEVINILESIIINCHLSTMTSVDTFGLASSTTSVEDEPGVSAFNGNNLVTMSLGNLFHLLVVVLVVSLVNVFFSIAASLYYDTWHLWHSRYLQSLVNITDVGNDTIGLQTSRGSYNERGLGMADAISKLLWGETTEDH
jgi:hypothetical protein